MSGHGDDAGRCSNGLTARNYRAASNEDRTIYRRWIRGMAVAYGALLLISGVVAVTNFQSSGLTKITALLAHPMTAATKSN
jgi:hypothetical protein